MPGPHDDARHWRFVRTLRERCATVYLCVIKDFGPEGKGMISFPKPGVTYALDIPIDASTQAVVDALNEVVLAEGGRVYLAKDAFTRAHHFRAMEPRLDAWNAVRRAWDPQGRLKSAQSVNIVGRPPVRAVVLGATKGMGRALARRMAERGDAVFLFGREAEDLARSAADLQIRGASGAVGFAHCDLLDPATFAPAFDAAERALGGLDAVIVTAGVFAVQDALEQDAELRERMLTANFTNTIEFCELARHRLLAAGGAARLCVFSSVAGERARKPVLLYGAAKAGLSYYLNGLDHKFTARGLRTILVKPGFVKTGMVAGLPVPPFAGEPDGVARTVLRAIDRGTPVVYAPAIWRWVMAVIRALPRAVMRRIEF